MDTGGPRAARGRRLRGISLRGQVAATRSGYSNQETDIYNLTSWLVGPAIEGRREVDWIGSKKDQALG